MGISIGQGRTKDNKKGLLDAMGSEFGGAASITLVN